jgi:hypothetical protein
MYYALGSKVFQRPRYRGGNFAYFGVSKIPSSCNHIAQRLVSTKIQNDTLGATGDGEALKDKGVLNDEGALEFDNIRVMQFRLY